MSDADNSLPPSGQVLKQAIRSLVVLLAAYRGDLDLAYVRSEFSSVADANDPRWGELDAWIKDQRDE